MNTESPVLPQIWHFSPKNLPISFQMNHCDTSQIEFVKKFELFYEKKNQKNSKKNQIFKIGWWNRTIVHSTK